MSESEERTFLRVATDVSNHVTLGHSERVGSLALRLYKAVSRGRPGTLSDTQLERLFALHDRGKLFIPRSILLKPDRLTDDEYMIMKLHPTLGMTYVTTTGDILMRDIVMFHHERYDGDGYPDGLSRNKIPLAARVTAVVDSYDAMVGYRPYRKPIPHKDAVHEIIQCAGKQFDPNVVEDFLRLI